MAKVNFSRGSQISYNNLRIKDEGTIYVCTDTGNVYMGSALLFDSDAFVHASISGKTITFTQHGDGARPNSVSLSLSSFQTAEEVQAAINAAMSALLKFKGSIAPRDVTSSLLVADNEGNVYNLSDDLEITSQNAALFVQGAVTVGDTLAEGTNIVVVQDPNGISAVYKFDVLSGLVDLSGYVEKPTRFSEGSIAEFDNTGGIRDSGYRTSNFKTVQTAVQDPTASGDTVEFISNITQNANGVISASKKTVRSATTAVAGIVQLTDSHTSTSTTTAATPKNVKEAYDLAASKVADVKTGTTAAGATTIVDGTSHVATILTETAYNASSNKFATMADVMDATPYWIELD